MRVEVSEQRSDGRTPPSPAWEEAGVRATDRRNATRSPVGTPVGRDSTLVCEISKLQPVSLDSRGEYRTQSGNHACARSRRNTRASETGGMPLRTDQHSPVVQKEEWVKRGGVLLEKKSLSNRTTPTEEGTWQTHHPQRQLVHLLSACCTRITSFSSCERW